MLVEVDTASEPLVGEQAAVWKSVKRTPFLPELECLVSGCGGERLPSITDMP